MTHDSALDVFPEISSRELLALEGVDVHIEASLREGTPDHIVGFLYQAKKAVQLTALATIKALAALRFHWTEFGLDESWDDYVYAEAGIKQTTANNYARVWRQVFENPEIDDSAKASLASWPLSSLVDISKAAEGGELQGHWPDVLACTNRSEVRELLGDIRGRPAESNGLKLILWQDGTIEAKEGARREVIGFLNPSEDDELIVKAVARVKNSAGLIDGA